MVTSTPSAFDTALAKAAPAAVMPPSPAPFTPRGLCGLGKSSVEMKLRLGHFHCRRHQIVHEVRCQWLAVFAVNEFLQDRAADSLSQAAGHLPFDDHRIDFTADIFGDQIVENFDLAGFLIHLYRGDMYAVRKRPLVGGEKSSSEMPGVMPLLSAAPGSARRARSARLTSALARRARRFVHRAGSNRRHRFQDCADASRSSFSFTLRDAPRRRCRP